MGLGGVNAIAFSPDGKKLAVGDQDGRVLLRDVVSGSTRSFDDGRSVNAVAFDADGTMLATGDDNGQILVRNLDNGSKTVFDDGSAVVVQGIALSPDGTVVTIDTDGQAVLWTSSKSKLLLSDNKAVWSLALSRDGTMLATGDADGEVNLRPSYVWNGDFGVLKRSLCSAFDGFDLTPAEWSAYVPDEPYQRTCG
jgi:WD40 repeat protein